MRRLAVVIGRFQPVHRFHAETLLAHAAANYDAVLVLLGSSKKARDEKNPLRWGERETLIRMTLPPDGSPFHFQPIKDYPYCNNRWVFQIQRLVDEQLEELWAPFDEEWEPVLVGVDKDDTSFYLRFFPQWTSDLLIPPPETLECSSTEIRRAMFEGEWGRLESTVAPAVRGWLKDWIGTDEGQRIEEEYRKAQDNRMVLAYEFNGYLRKAPYPPIFHTTDSVVLWRGHVLLIQRRAAPGKGLWALPGGHLDAKEWIRVGAVRERQEESRIRFFHKSERRRLQLHADWCKARHTFDHPGRSLRGRTITEGFLWVIPDEYEVEIEAGDDAARAQWFPLYEALHVMDYDLFEDHQAIIHHFAMGAT